VFLIVEVPTGAFADHIGRRQSMMLGALAMVGSCLVSYLAHDFGTFAASQVLAGVSMALCSGADSAYLFDLLHGNGRGEEYPVREGHASAWHLFGNVGAFLAGGVLASIDLGLPYLVNAGTAALAFCVAMMMRDEQPLRVRTPQPLGDELRQYLHLMRASLGDAARNKRLAWIIVYSAVVFALLRVTDYLYQPYLHTRGFDPMEMGLVFAGISGFAAFMALRADGLRRWLGEGALVWALLAILAVSFLVLHSLAAPFALIVLAVQGAINGVYSPLVKPIINREITDSGRRATVLSVESIARRAAIGVVSLVAAGYGAYSAIYWCGALGLAGFAILALGSRWAPGARKRPVRHEVGDVGVVDPAPAPAKITLD
jgi:MFS family permease